MFNVMFDLTLELRNGKGRKLLKNCFKLVGGRQMKTVNPRRARQGGGKRNARTGLADKPSVMEVNQQRIVTEKRGSKKRARDISDPEEVLRIVGLIEGDWEDPPSVGTDSCTICCYQIRGPG